MTSMQKNLLLAAANSCTPGTIVSSCSRGRGQGESTKGMRRTKLSEEYLERSALAHMCWITTFHTRRLWLMACRLWKFTENEKNRTLLFIFNVLKEAFRCTTWQALLSKERRRTRLALSAPMEIWEAATGSISTWFRSEISLHLRVLHRPVQRQHSALSAAISPELSLCICFKWSERTSQFSLVQWREKKPPSLILYL